MEKHNYSQLELFSQERDYSDKKTGVSRSFLDLVWRYEKTIIVIICFIITGVISFSLGVEKGKRIQTILAKTETIKPTALRATMERQKIVNLQRAKNNLPRTTESFVSKGGVRGLQTYTVQLATYKVRTYAQKEAEILKKKGLFPLILSQGNYAVLCVGNLPNRNEAKILLSQFRKESRYKDCYIRRL